MKSSRTMTEALLDVPAMAESKRTKPSTPQLVGQVAVEATSPQVSAIPTPSAAESADTGLGDFVKVLGDNPDALAEIEREAEGGQC